MSKVTKPNNENVDETGRLVDVNNPSSTISRIKLLLLPHAANYILAEKFFFHLSEIVLSHN